MNVNGVLSKMKTKYTSPIQYYLEIGGKIIDMNRLIGGNIEIYFDKYQCLSCGRTKKIYRQGYCYNCFFESPKVGDWILRPEMSKAHLNIEDRDLEYEKKVQLQPHIVYLALSSKVKVGVTRKPEVPTRWIDQGASKAIAMLELPNRYLAGITEVALKQHVSDKTSWQRMLKNELADIDLLEQKEMLSNYVPDETKRYFLYDNTELFVLNYPVLQYPQKVKSLKLDKHPVIKGKLIGIKGQYLIFDDGSVFNVRNHEGYVVDIIV